MKGWSLDVILLRVEKVGKEIEQKVTDYCERKRG